MDETSKQHVKETRLPLPTRAGDVEKYDYEYERNGVRSCLNRRIPDQQTLRDEVAAWLLCRNAEAADVNWRFTAEDARIKLKRLYPSIDN